MTCCAARNWTFACCGQFPGLERRTIHIWITPEDSANANYDPRPMFAGPSGWRESHIQVYSIYRDGDRAVREQELRDLIQAGRIPVSEQNIEMVEAPRRPEGGPR